jgi:hypothetical protein
MMLKAMHFGDRNAFDMIEESSTPREAKMFGRKVEDYDDEEWAKVRVPYMFTAVYAKFANIPQYSELLLSTKGKTLVEASPKDKIWGVGLHETNDAILDERNWDGLNLLGKVLNAVRETL